MAARKKARKKNASKPAVTVRYANPSGARMAKRKHKRKGGHHRRRSNPANPRHHRRRRRNPSGDFASRLGRLALGATVALGTAVGVTYLTAKVAPGNPLSLYGIPAVVFLAGVAINKKMPVLGAGLAIGAPAPFALPVASKLLSMGTPVANPTSTAAGIARAYRTMRAVHMGNGYSRMGAVHMGAVHPG